MIFLKTVIKIMPIKSNVLIHEKLKESDKAGMIKIIKKIKLPIKPKLFEIAYKKYLS